jgi:DNA-binding MarR family transcriptional regulator
LPRDEKPDETERVSLRLTDYLPYQLSLASNQVSRMVARAYQARFGLTIWEWRIIAVLGEGEPTTAQALCEATAMDKVTVSRAVRSLADRNLISRSENATDRRSSLLCLTDDGLSVYDDVAPVTLGAERDLIEGMSAGEVALLVQLLNRLKDRAQSILGE